MAYTKGENALQVLPRAGTLPQQEALGQRLGRMVPQYESADPDPEAHAARMARSLKIPLAMLSLGPTVDYKVFRKW